MPRGLVRGRLVWALVVSLLVGVALVAVVVDVPLLAHVVEGATQTEAALVLVRFLLAVPVGALAGGWALRRLGNGVVAGGGLALTTVGLAAMSTWGRSSLDHLPATLVLALAGLGIGLALAPVNDAALAEASTDATARHPRWSSWRGWSGWSWASRSSPRSGCTSTTGVVATLPDPTDTEALKGAAVVQVAWVFRGAAVAAGLGALASLALGLRRRTGEHATTFGL